MDDTIKWILLSELENVQGKYALDKLAAEYRNIPDTDLRFCTPEAQNLLCMLENPPIDGVRVICYKDECYPKRLMALSSPPPVLYARGDISLLSDGVTAAVVGSRSASAYGISVTMDFCRDFCEAGITVISGGARGIDTAAAETAVKYGGKTIAVFGCGIDVAYPAENKKLFEKIIASGGVTISEYPFGTAPISAHFPRRNRLIAALSDCCVVTEAGLKSGSLITANFALELRKPLFAVPGNITSKESAGTNHLIKTGASLAVSGMQVAAELKVLLSFSERKSAPKKQKFTPLFLGKDKAKGTPPRKKKEQISPKTEKLDNNSSENEKIIIDAILAGKTSAAELADATGLPETLLTPALVMMELNGIIKKEYGERYSLVR